MHIPTQACPCSEVGQGISFLAHGLRKTAPSAPTLCSFFSASFLLQGHAADTYAQFAEQNEATLKAIPPPLVALNYYKSGGRGNVGWARGMCHS
jgi:hypothetical protein